MKAICRICKVSICTAITNDRKEIIKCSQETGPKSGKIVNYTIPTEVHTYQHNKNRTNTAIFNVRVIISILHNILNSKWFSENFCGQNIYIFE